MIQKIRLNLIIRFFKLKPAIKKLDKGNYLENMEGFKKHYNEISERTKKESGIMAFHRMFMIIGLAGPVLHEQASDGGGLEEGRHPGAAVQQVAVDGAADRALKPGINDVHGEAPFLPGDDRPRQERPADLPV